MLMKARVETKNLRHLETEGHTKRCCPKKKLDDVAAAATTDGHTPTNGIHHDPVSTAADAPPNVSAPTMAPQHAPPIASARPEKLPTKRRSSPPPGTYNLDPMQGASSGTSARFSNIFQYVATPGFLPTPGFKPPRKKN
ncbi:hypothetical protein PIB30_066055 [Stylosanthes scabra]|uniref:Uncharacterized protein n=1 Tax=Stylosanthes scabra TaxID=79078 RepID=A0ABU6QMK6_9FABA|nr:hypothetical protein [Stylosanthes scabra]